MVYFFDLTVIFVGVALGVEVRRPHHVGVNVAASVVFLRYMLLYNEFL